MTDDDLDLAILDYYRDFVTEFKSAKKLLDAQAAYVGQMRDHILDLIGEKEGGSIDGQPVLRRTPVAKRETVDKKQLKKRWPEAYQACVGRPDGVSYRLDVL